MAAAEESSFRKLLAQLGEEHERELNALRVENEKLRAKLRALRPSGDEMVCLEDVDFGVDFPRTSPANELSPHNSVSTTDEAGEDLADLKAQAITAAATMVLFDVKGTWTDVPVASGVWGQELDELIAERDTKNMVAYTVGRPCGSMRTVRIGGQQVTIRISTGVIDPGSTGRMIWDISGMALISFDVINIPLMAFEPEDNWFTVGLSWITLLFWTGDMFASCCTGYFQEGQLVTDRARILQNYLKTWFAVDCIVVVPDWVMTLMGSTSNVAGLGRVLRAARAVRVLRLLRLLKLQKLINAFYDMIESEYMFIVVNLAKLLLFILVLNHIVACAWFMVGRISRMVGADKNWLENSGMTPVWDEGLGWRYTTSLHWSITQFTPASMDISATNTGERIFSIFILFWALVALSSVIGSVSASMTALRNMKGDEQKQFWLLRRYLRQRKVSKELMNRIMKYTEHQVQAKHNILSPSKVALLGQMSEQLNLELSNEINSPVLSCHPFFKCLSTKMPIMMYRICNCALKTTSYACDDAAFHEGDEAKQMYFVKMGTWKYRQHGPPLQKRSFVGEPVLWTSWRHRGDLVATSEPSELMSVMPGPFGEVLRLHPRPWAFARRYAVEFVNYMNTIETNALSDVIFSDDLFEHALGLSIAEHDRTSDFPSQ